MSLCLANFDGLYPAVRGLTMDDLKSVVGRDTMASLEAVEEWKANSTHAAAPLPQYTSVGNSALVSGNREFEARRATLLQSPANINTRRESGGIGRVGDIPSDATDDVVFDALASAKIIASSYATHMTNGERSKLFQQLDRLHDTSEWEPGDSPVSRASFATFLRSLLWIKPSRWPSLGLTHDGHLLAIWGTVTDRVTLEFLDGDQIRWALTHRFPDSEPIRTAGMTASFHIRDALVAHDPAHWFDAE